MKKLNNKGFAISTILYGLLVVMMLLTVLLMNTMSFSRKNSKDFTDDTRKTLETKVSDVIDREAPKTIFVDPGSYKCIDTPGTYYISAIVSDNSRTEGSTGLVGNGSSNIDENCVVGNSKGTCSLSVIHSEEKDNLNKKVVRKQYTIQLTSTDAVGYVGIELPQLWYGDAAGNWSGARDGYIYSRLFVSSHC